MSEFPTANRQSPTADSRPYADEADYTRMRDLLTEKLRINGPPEYPTAGDLDWWRAADLEDAALRSSRLWFAGDALVAFAWFDDDLVELFTLPRWRGLEPEMLAWAEATRAAGGVPDEPRTLTVWAMEGDELREALVRERGYRRTETYLYHWMQPLPATLPPRPLPPGYSLRNVQGEADFASRVAAHRSAFAPSKMTLEKYLRARSMPGYREDHDIVAVAPDGTIAAFCIVWNDGVSGVGLFEPVGTHAEHQQLGLGRGVLHEGMRRLTAEGAHTATVLSVGGRESSYRLYQSAGFRVLGRNFAWEKAVSYQPSAFSQ